jgi:hypothetical protein
VASGTHEQGLKFWLRSRLSGSGVGVRAQGVGRHLETILDTLIGAVGCALTRVQLLTLLAPRCHLRDRDERRCAVGKDEVLSSVIDVAYHVVHPFDCLGESLPDLDWGVADAVRHLDGESGRVLRPVLDEDLGASGVD